MFQTCENLNRQASGTGLPYEQGNKGIFEFGGKPLSVRGQYADIFPCNDPVNPQYKDYSERQKSFASWPKTAVVNSNELAAAGLFYLGDRDRCKCFYCNGGLQHWEHGDDPMLEHAKYFPQCEFVLQQKGPDFVADLNSRHPNITRPSLVSSNTQVNQTATNLDFEHQARNNAALHQAALQPMDIPPQIPSKPSDTSCENMNELIEQAKQFGFSESTINTLVTKKLHNNGVPYATLSEFICDLINFEEEQKNNVEKMTVCEDHSPSNCQIGPGLMKVGYQQASTCGIAHSILPTRRPEVTADGSGRFEADSVLKSQLQGALDESLCKVCRKRDRSCAFMSCGHLCCCFECGHQLQHCPICNSKILQAIKIYKT